MLDPFCELEKTELIYFKRFSDVELLDRVENLDRYFSKNLLCTEEQYSNFRENLFTSGMCDQDVTKINGIPAEALKIAEEAVEFAKKTNTNTEIVYMSEVLYVTYLFVRMMLEREASLQYGKLIEKSDAVFSKCLGNDNDMITVRLAYKINKKSTDLF